MGLREWAWVVIGLTVFVGGVIFAPKAVRHLKSDAWNNKSGKKKEKGGGA